MFEPGITPCSKVQKEDNDRLGMESLKPTNNGFAKQQ